MWKGGAWGLVVYQGWCVPAVSLPGTTLPAPAPAPYAYPMYELQIVTGFDKHSQVSM